ncbi:MAG: CBS domain-containing protein, partial [Heliobacteriaceae bacterium]|nr:CBS domain-containing protein [Heliobacteriaceae bacterium]
RLPVVDNGKLVGIVSLGDLATVDIYQNEAGQALSEISEPTQRLYL